MPQPPGCPDLEAELRSIQLLLKWAPSLRELQGGDEHDSPTPRGLNPFAERSQARSLENWKSENKQTFVQSWQYKGEDRQLLPASAGLTVPECPFLSFSAHLQAASTTPLCPLRGRTPPRPSGQLKEKRGGHLRPPRRRPGCRADLSQEEACKSAGCSSHEGTSPLQGTSPLTGRLVAAREGG